MSGVCSHQRNDMLIISSFKYLLLVVLFKLEFFMHPNIQANEQISSA